VALKTDPATDRPSRLAALERVHPEDERGLIARCKKQFARRRTWTSQEKPPDELDGF
jgi:hypothetical protein